MENFTIWEAFFDFENSTVYNKKIGTIKGSSFFEAMNEFAKKNMLEIISINNDHVKVNGRNFFSNQQACSNCHGFRMRDGL